MRERRRWLTNGLANTKEEVKMPAKEDVEEKVDVAVNMKIGLQGNAAKRIKKLSLR